jgi:hypothetical protein
MNRLDRLDTIKNDKKVGVYEGDVENRNKWKFMTRAADPK